MTNETDTTKETKELTPEQKAEQEKEFAELKEKVKKANDDANRIIKLIEEKGEDKGVRWTQLFLQSLCGYIDNAFMSKRTSFKVNELGLLTENIKEQNERDITEFTLDVFKDYSVYDAVKVLDTIEKIIDNKIILEQIKRPLSELKLNFTANEQDKDKDSELPSETSV